MNSNLLGEQIAKFRKELGMTQEDLSKAVSISAQAVSRWECGGAPDVALLPAVADKLGVTIDALFGREGGEKVDMVEAVWRWMFTIPPDQRLDQLCRLVWRAANPAMMKSSRPEDEVGEPSLIPRCCEKVTWNGRTEYCLYRTRVLGERGFLIGVYAQDMSFVSIWPEPEEGYRAFLEDNDLYRRLFELLAKPHCLELMEHLLCRTARLDRHFTAGVLAKQMGLETAEVEPLLASMADLRLLLTSELDTEDGVVPAFLAYETEGWISFLYLARWLITGGNSSTTHQRVTPLLREEPQQKKGAI